MKFISLLAVSVGLLVRISCNVHATRTIDGTVVFATAMVGDAQGMFDIIKHEENPFYARRFCKCTGKMVCYFPRISCQLQKSVP